MGTDITSIIEEVIKHTTKHEVVYGHEHKTIEPTDVVLTTGIEGVEKPSEADKAEEVIEAAEGNYDNIKVAKKTGQDLREDKLSKKITTEKHLPMRHDQKQHAGEVAASAKIASTGGLSSAQHVELGNRLKRLSAVEGLPSSLKKRILAARATLKGIDPAKKMSPVEKKAYAKAIREAKVSALAASKYMKGKKKFEGKPKPVITKPTKPVQKKPVQPGQATPVQGQAKMTGGQVAQQAAAVQAKKGPLTFREKAISWLDGVVKKTGDSIKAFNAWNQGVLTSTFKQIKDKQAMSKKYNTWKNWQTSANSYRSALQREIVRSRGSNVPTRQFYELSRKYLDTQGTADKARGQFETFVGFDSEQLLAAMNKSTAGEPQKLNNLNLEIEKLETPYL